MDREDWCHIISNGIYTGLILSALDDILKVLKAIAENMGISL